MEMSHIAILLEQARERALNGGLPVRRKDAKLYILLAECLAICEEVISTNMFEELRRLAVVSVNHRQPRGTVTRAESNNGRGRNYVEKNSDAFILVSRYVLSADGERNSPYRYATTLREAHRRNIPSDQLKDWLTENGGVQALFLTRPVVARSGRTKILHLTESIEYPKSGKFVVTLEYDGRGHFIPKTHYKDKETT
jgi:hypothetical protein